MQTRRQDIFTTIHTEGSILPADLLQRIAENDSSLGGLRPEDYHLFKGEKLNEAINRSWNHLLGAWESFKALISQREGDPNPLTTETRERWLLPLFQELGYGRLQTAHAIQVNGKSYPVSHLWGRVPIHLVGANLNLDRRTAGVAGAARSSPHSMVQELLNASDEYLWGFVSNGYQLRILRDNSSLTRQAYVEFDLRAMMDGEVYSDFVLLWLLCHQSRVEGDRPAECWLEKWSREAHERGTRALDRLRDGVQEAINVLGSGFLSHPANSLLREKLRAGELSAQDYYRQLLRLVYRLIFLFVAEDRDLLLLRKGVQGSSPDEGAGVSPDSSPSSVYDDGDALERARERYMRYYSTTRLRRLAARRRGTRHADLFQGLRLVMEQLGSDSGYPALALPALGSFLFSNGPNGSIPDLERCQLANSDLLTAIRELAYTVDANTLRPVDYRNLGSEELGSVYEALLELHPELNADAGTFTLKEVSGNERKSTGSYYTPNSLVNSLLDSALDPVLDEAVRGAAPTPGPSHTRGQESPTLPLPSWERGHGGEGTTAEERILSLKVCDPACGSGHFLVAAAHRIARRLASVRTGDEQPSPEATRKALRDVIGRCIYGVDLNPMAVELCKVSLWMEALEPGKPLSFLDHHIKVGNSLIGATPRLLKEGIPDEAFEPIEGDDSAVCSEYKRKNKQERTGQQRLAGFDMDEPFEQLGDLGTAMLDIERYADDTTGDIHHKQKRYEQLVNSAAYEHMALLANAWCAAFVWRKTRDSYPITHDELRRIRVKGTYAIPDWRKAEIERLARQYGFFHWHLEFPSVFRPAAGDERPGSEAAGWVGGFDVVLGNPPWERIKLQEQEWFASRSPDIANAPNAAARKRMIQALKTEDPDLYAAFREDLRQAEGQSHFVRHSGRFPLTGRGDVNTYAVFAETFRLLLAPTGRAGVIVPTGIATDDTTKFFFQDLMDTRSLVSLYDFENREGLFPGVHRSYKFCLLTMSGVDRPAQKGAEFVFFAQQVSDLDEEGRRFTLSAEDIALLNPNTRTCPIFRSRRDAELTKAIYRRVPVLIKEGPEGYERNPWGIRFLSMFHMANDSGLFRTREQLEAEGWRLEGNVFFPPAHPHPPAPSAAGHPHPPAPSPTRGEGEQDRDRERERDREQEQQHTPLSLHGRGAGGEGAHEAGGEGTDEEVERWDIPPLLARQMVELARRFRKAPTPSETILWQALRGRQLDGRKFRRQQPIGPFVVDFYCPSERLVVEVDGPIHDRPAHAEDDRARQRLLEQLGVRFVRVPSALVEKNLPAALQQIRGAFGQHPHPPAPSATAHPHPPAPSPTRGEGEQDREREREREREQEQPHTPLSLHGRGAGGEGAHEAGGEGARGAGGEGERTHEGLYLPLYEAKMIHHFNHRWATFTHFSPGGRGDGGGSENERTRDITPAELADPAFVVQPRYWVPAAEVEARLAGRWDRRWLLGWRDICRSTDERTVIAGVLPWVGVGDKFLLMLPSRNPINTAPLYSMLNSFALDYAGRQKQGGTSLKYFTMKQLPVLPPETYDQPAPWQSGVTLREWILPRVLELTYTAWDLEPFARDCGYVVSPHPRPLPPRGGGEPPAPAPDPNPAPPLPSWERGPGGEGAPPQRGPGGERVAGPPFRWDEERRFLLRCELDAAYFHLYGIARDDVGYIMDTFPIVCRKDEEKYGEYRTKRVILEIYDAMHRAIQTGQPYQTLLDPPPADPSLTHPAPTRPDWLDRLYAYTHAPRLATTPSTSGPAAGRRASPPRAHTMPMHLPALTATPAPTPAPTPVPTSGPEPASTPTPLHAHEQVQTHEHAQADGPARPARQAAVEPAAGTGRGFRVGDRVRHPTFGEGRVLAVEPRGQDQIVTVQFDSVGKKKLMAKVARLEQVESPTTVERES